MGSFPGLFEELLDLSLGAYITILLEFLPNLGG
jgi:hypothetical protein